MAFNRRHRTAAERKAAPTPPFSRRGRAQRTSRLRRAPPTRQTMRSLSPPASRLSSSICSATTSMHSTGPRLSMRARTQVTPATWRLSRARRLRTPSRVQASPCRASVLAAEFGREPRKQRSLCLRSRTFAVLVTASGGVGDRDSETRADCPARGRPGACRAGAGRWTRRIRGKWHRGFRHDDAAVRIGTGTSPTPAPAARPSEPFAVPSVAATLGPSRNLEPLSAAFQSGASRYVSPVSRPSHISPPLSEYTRNAVELPARAAAISPRRCCNLPTRVTTNSIVPSRIRLLICCGRCSGRGLPRTCRRSSSGRCVVRYPNDCCRGRRIRSSNRRAENTNVEQKRGTSPLFSFLQRFFLARDFRHTVAATSP